MAKTIPDDSEEGCNKGVRLSQCKYLSFACAVLTAASVARSSQPYYSDPPVLSQHSYVVNVDLNVPGSKDFVISGSATDPHPGDVVQFGFTGRPFLSFTTIPGNPGYFTISGSNISEPNLGSYNLVIDAFDDLRNISNADLASFKLTIVPEPSTAALSLVAVFAITRRRR